jgi:hypothetical protein
MKTFLQVFVALIIVQAGSPAFAAGKTFSTCSLYLCGAMLVGLTSCAPQPQDPPPVPEAREEAIPNPPVTTEELVWQPGHWDWDGASYQWAPGEYVPAGGHGLRWMPGWWDRTEEKGWQWEAPHWVQ